MVRMVVVAAALCLLVGGAEAAMICTQLGNQLWCSDGQGGRVVCTTIGQQTFCR